MEQRRLNFEAPLLSIRRISKKQEFSGELEKKENPTEALSACTNTERSIVPVCLPDRSFDHLTEPASVPFVWEQIPGRPKNDIRPEENLKERLVEKDNLQNELEQDDDDDESYSDALDDMVSLNDSFSVNCSVSGLSEYEKKIRDDEEESGNFCEGILPEYRDLMMCRFLPASKAMALKHQSQSQSQSQQQQQKNRISSSFENKKQMRLIPREATVLVPGRMRLVSRCEDLNNDETEETDDDDGDDHDHDDNDDYDYRHRFYSKVAKKACGFLPKLCMKNSLSVLNPVSALRIKTCRNLEQYGRKILNPKPRENSVQKQNIGFQSQSSSPRFCGKNHTVNDFSGDHQLQPSWSSRRLSGFISPHRYASNRSSLSESGFVETLKKDEILRVNRLNRVTSKSQELYPRRRREISDFFSSPDLEEKKRLSASAVSSPGTRTPRSSVSRTQSRIGRIAVAVAADYNNNHKSLTRSYSIQDVKLLAEEVKRRRNVLGTSCSEQRSLVTVSPPPLPKTPSESWLWRTLPSVTPRNSIPNPYVMARLNSKKQQQETPESTKWETIVKTSYVHHDHNRYSEELIVHPSCHGKI